jgi:hypothetical protein
MLKRMVRPGALLMVSEDQMIDGLRLALVKALESVE